MKYWTIVTEKKKKRKELSKSDLEVLWNLELQSSSFFMSGMLSCLLFLVVFW